VTFEECIDRVVEIEFYDHTVGEQVTEIAKCIVWGRLLSVTERQVVIQHWEVDKSSTDNATTSALVRSTIRRMTPMIAGLN